MDPRDATSVAVERLHDLGAFIREQRRIAELSLRNLSTLAGVSNPYLSQIERGLRKPSAEILQAIARALAISAETLYVRAGILEERESDLTAAILADETLTEKQRRALLEIYRSFRQEHAPPAQEQEPPARRRRSTGAAEAAAPTQEAPAAEVS